MSKQIDERIVEMQFDNKMFEQNAQQSISTLDKLKNSLNIGNSGKNLTGMDKLVSSGALQSISSNVESIADRFSFMGRIAGQVMDDIISKVVNVGERLIREFTLEPITDGFNEYNLKMGSVQTIMASTHQSLDKVNDVLAKLNEYSDKTIYSFSDMTASIGKFTNAGVDLDVAVKAIQGISNEAALSGANANEASRAMYNFAQALSSGAVKLIDWKSIENANMATAEFKEVLLESAESLKTVEKQSDGTYKALTKGAGGAFKETFTATTKFNDSLQSCWMTTDVLIDALSKYSDETTDIGKRAFAAAQDVKTFGQLMDTLKEAAGSGWAESFELIVGDFEEAKALWTSVNNIVSPLLDKMSDARNKVLREGLHGNSYFNADMFDELSKSVKADALIEQLKRTAEESGIYVGDISDNLEEFKASLDKNWLDVETAKRAMASLDGGVFGYSGTDNSKFEAIEFNDKTEEVRQLQNVLKELGYDLGNTDVDGWFGSYTEGAVKAFQAANNLEQTGRLNKETIEALTKAEQDYYLAQSEANGEAKKYSDIIDEMTGMNGRELGIDAIHNAYLGVASVLRVIGETFKTAFPKFEGSDLFNLLKGINDFSQKLKPTSATLFTVRKASLGLFESIDFLRQGFVTLGGPVVSTLAKGLAVVGHDILNVTGEIGAFAVRAVYAAEKAGVWQKAQEKLSATFSPFVDLVGKGYNAAKDYVKSINYSELLDKLSAKYKKVMDFLKPYTTLISEAKDKLLAYVGAISKEDIQNKFAAGLEKLNTILKPVSDRLTAVKNNLIEYFKATNTQEAKEKLSVIFEKLKERVLALWEVLKTGGSSIIDFFNRIRGLFSKTEEAAGELTGGKSGFQKFVEYLSVYLKPTSILKIAASVTALVRAFVAFRKLQASIDMLSNISKFFKSATATVKSLKKNPLSQQVLQIAAAIGILCGSLYMLAKLKPEEALQAVKMMVGLFAGMGLLLGGIAAMAQFIGGKAIEKTGKGILMFSAALLVLSVAMISLFEVVTKAPASVAVLVGMMAAIGLFFTLMNKFAPKTGKIGTGILAMAGAVLILSFALGKMKDLSLTEILTSFLAILNVMAAVALGAKLFEVLGVGLKTFNQAGKGLLITAVAMTVLAVALKMFATLNFADTVQGLIAMGGAMAIIALSATAMSKVGLKSVAVIALLTGVMIVISAVLASFAGLDFGAVAKGLIGVAAALAIMGVAAGVMGAFAGTLLMGAAVIAAFSAALLLLHVAVAAISGDMSSLGDTFSGAGSKIVEALSGLGSNILGALSGIGTWIMDSLSGGIDALLEFGGNFIKSIPGALAGVESGISNAFIGVYGWVTGAISSGLDAAKDFGANIIGEIGSALAPVGETIMSAFASAKEWIFEGGLQAAIDSAFGFGRDFIEKIKSGLSGLPSQVFVIFNNLWTTISNAIKDIPQKLYEWAVSLPGKIVDGINSKIDEVGEAIAALFSFGFGSGSGDSGKQSEAGKEVGEQIVSGINSASTDEEILAFLDSIGSGVSSNAGTVESSGEDIADAIVDGALTGASSQSSSASRSILDMMFGNMDDSIPKTSGEKSGNSYASGVSSKKSAARTAGSTLASTAASSMDGKSSITYGAGASTSQGFVNGMNSLASTIWSTAYNLGKKGAEAFGQGAQVHSPSEITTDAGIFTSRGYIDGMLELSRKIYSTGCDMGDYGAKGFEIGAQYVSDILDGVLDIDPTIRPVLDISGIKTGVDDATSMLNNMSSMSLGATVGANIDSRRQNRNDETVVAINKLGSILRNMPRNTYNVNGVTYDDGSNVSNAVASLISAIELSRRM